MDCVAHRFNFILVIFALVVLPCQVRAEDAVMERLFQAKKKYDDEILKFKKAVTDTLNALEEKARKSGDKKLVDEIKADRDAFENERELPKSLPASIISQYNSTRSSLESAYKNAITEYTKTKQDDAATAIEKQLEEFKKSSLKIPSATDELSRSTDKIASDLKAAKEAYKSVVEKSNEKLGQAFDAQKKKLEDNTKLKVDQQLKLIEDLQKERKSFESSSIMLPKSASMTIAVRDYQTATVAAKKVCVKAFDKAAEEFRKNKDLEAAKGVLADKTTFFAKVAGDKRFSWAYTDGSFSYEKDGSWLEAKTNGERFYFNETDRTADYVELTNKTADFAIRLFVKHAEIRRDKGPFKHLFAGVWTEQ